MWIMCIILSINKNNFMELYTTWFGMENVLQGSEKKSNFAVQKKRKDLNYGKIKHSNGD